MLFGKHINRYYLRYAGWLILGLFALVLVDGLQLEIPKLYGMLINGMNEGFVVVDGVETPFDFHFLLDTICMPMVKIILAMVFGRFLWRICHIFHIAKTPSSTASKNIMTPQPKHSCTVSRSLVKRLIRSPTLLT